MGMGEDFFTIDLMSAYTSLGKIIGEELEDDLVSKIFAEFCMVNKGHLSAEENYNIKNKFIRKIIKIQLYS